MTASAAEIAVTVVVPSVGRPCLRRLVDSLEPQLRGRADIELIAVDDQLGGRFTLDVSPAWRRLVSGGRGPAAARNVGWRAGRGRWIAFLDDDVIPTAGWLADLGRDLGDAGPRTGGIQGHLRVPLPSRPDDWQQETVALMTADWITADMAYRRAALEMAGGFDERFPRAFREDAELAHRVRTAGWDLVRGRRCVEHPPRPEGRWVSIHRQRGNADDALLRRAYGPRWHTRLGIPRGRRHRHAAITGCALVALAAGALATIHTRSRTRWYGRLSAMATIGWAVGTGEFVVHRARRAPAMVSRPVELIGTSVAIPPVALAAWSHGWIRHRNATAMPVTNRAGAAV
jgi:glycosyltransferase involved in cell wall biosynthesis